MYTDVDVTTVALKIKEGPNNSKMCAMCKKQVPTKDIVVVNQLRFSCGYCKKNFKSRESFWFHIFGHEGGGMKKLTTHQCPMCLKEFVNKTSLQNHILTHKEQLYAECPNCQSRFIDKVNFQHHLTVFHAAAAGETVLSFLQQHKLRITATPMCKVCQTKNGYHCDVCYVEATTLERLATHRAKTHIKCPDCQKYVIRTEDLEQHTALDHDPAKRHACPTCKMRFAKPSELKVHASLHIVNNHNATPKVVEGGLKCSVCKEYFKEKAELKRHVENKHFFCPLCNLVFKVGNKFSKHVQMSHSYWPVSCKFCKERCWKVFELRRHLRNKHNADYDVVGLGYHERSAKYDDEVVVVEATIFNGPKSVTTTVQASDVSTRPTSTLSVSNNSNSAEMSGSVPTNNVECELIKPVKLYNCFYCRLAYPKVPAVVSHIRSSHQRYSPYHCSICNDSMWEDYVFQLHCIKHEKELSKVIIVGNVISQLPANYDLGETAKNETDNSEEAEVTYRCPYCPTKFTRMQHINSHVKQVHTGEAPYGCDICKQLMWELVEFEGHYRKHSSMNEAEPIIVIQNRIKLQSEGSDGRLRIVESKLESLMEKMLNVSTRCNIGLRQRNIREVLRDLLTVEDETLPSECELDTSKPLVSLEHCFKALLHRIPLSDNLDDSWIDEMPLGSLVSDMDTVLQANSAKCIT